ncbi:MAG: orotate phosphoribosyltransferase [Pirellulales bacterium]|nr:orotate phosphoribosyltransferase [Pirellulales bacterium]
MYQREVLLELIRQKALKFGNFTLASGRQATYYLDGKQVTLDSRGLRLIGGGILELLKQIGPWPHLIGGLAIGADPLTAAVLTLAGEENLPLAGVLIRKEAKGHGLQKYLEGPAQPGNTIVIVEDVVTTGGSSLTAIERCREFGLQVQSVICVIDRLEGGAAAFAAQGLTLHSLFTIRDFGLEPPVL